MKQLMVQFQNALYGTMVVSLLYYQKFVKSLTPWDIRTQHVKIPTNKEEIDHVENLFCHVGYPGCLESIDCVHIPWRKCTCKLQTQCKNKKRAVQQLFLRWWRPTLLGCCTFHACFGGVAPMHLYSSLMRLCTRSWMADTPLLLPRSHTFMGIK
jgi:hypothetical protein